MEPYLRHPTWASWWTNYLLEAIQPPKAFSQSLWTWVGHLELVLEEHERLAYHVKVEGATAKVDIPDIQASAPSLFERRGMRGMARSTLADLLLSSLCLYIQLLHPQKPGMSGYNGWHRGVGGGKISGYGRVSGRWLSSPAPQDALK